MKTIVFTGPESTGKSWLSGYLAGYFKTTWVPEYLREFYKTNNGIAEHQMQTVAKGQLQKENEALLHNFPLLFLDTNIISLKVYHQYYYKKEPIWFKQLYDQSKYNHYILLTPDIPWTPDPQRESAQVREELFPLFLQELESLKVSFSIVGGNYQDRLQKSIEIIEQIIQ